MMKQIDTTGRESSTETASKISQATKKWKRLEQKYLDYIDLLKSKISKTERKLAHQARSLSLQKCLGGLVCATHSLYSKGFFNIKKAAERAAESQRQFNCRGIPLAPRECDVEIVNLFHSTSEQTSPNTEKHRVHGMNIVLEKLANKTKMETFQVLKQTSPEDVLSNVEDRLHLLKAQFLGEAEVASSTKGQSTKTELFVNGLIRENCRLKIKLQKAEKMEKALQRQLALNNDQREKQNAKKTEGLELLAEEIREKDEKIRQLQKQLEYYDQQAFCVGGRVLTPTTSAQYQLELRKLEEQIQKITDEMHHKDSIQKEEIKRLNQKLVHFGNLETERLNLEGEVEKFRKIKFDLEYENISLRNEKEELTSRLSIAEMRDEEIAALELARREAVNQISKIYRVIHNPQTGDEDKLRQISNLINNPLALQKKPSNPSQILRVVDRLFDDPQCADQQCLDEAVKNQLKTISSKIKLLRESSTKSSSNKDQKLFDSVMYIFPERKLSGDDKIFREKCRLEEQILDLKEKAMHIRKIVLEFVRALELRKVPRHVEAIMSVLFELFEYSEEERGQMVDKKSRGFFGIFN